MKKSYTMLEIEKAQNLSNLSLKELDNSPVKDKIKWRQKRVNHLCLRGYTNQQIADKIGCNLSTVEKDLSAIRENTRHWYEEDSIVDYCTEINDGIVLYENMNEDLQILYADEPEVDTKIQILGLMSTFESKKIELLEKTKAVQRYLKEKEHGK